MNALRVSPSRHTAPPESLRHLFAFVQCLRSQITRVTTVTPRLDRQADGLTSRTLQSERHGTASQ